MAKQVIASNNAYDLFFHEEDKIIHHIFKEDLDGLSFREVLNKGHNILKQNGATKWLSDNRRQMSVLSDEDNAWANDVWFPKTQAAGWKYWAIVVPDSMANRADLVRYIDSFYNSGIKVQVFTQDDEAYKWLLQFD